MSLFKRRTGQDNKKKDNKKKSDKAAKPTEPTEPKEPMLVAVASATEDSAINESAINESAINESAIKDKVQGEVRAISARTILEVIQSSQAGAPSMDELVRQQAINRLYADVLYDLLSNGAAPDVDPSARVLAWAREATDGWGRGQKNVDADLTREREALARSILAALDSATRDGTLRKAAERRYRASGQLTADD